MQKTLILALGLWMTCVTLSNAQFSIYGKYNLNTTEWQTDWTRLVNDVNVYNDSQTAGLAYWLRLKNYRVEFHPGIYVFRSNTDLLMANNTQVSFTADQLTIEGVGFEVPVHFYFMDFEGDCNCPTFSKDGNFFTKGFFGYVNPGVRLSNYRFDNLVVNETSLDLGESRDSRFTIGVGGGLDIGLGDLFTLTPFGGLELSPSNMWNAMTQIIAHEENGVVESRNLRSLNFGLRLAFRPDYLKDKRSMYR